jgi:isoquinoline 1-oxidoreductase subunit beta
VTSKPDPSISGAPLSAPSRPADLSRRGLLGAFGALVVAFQLPAAQAGEAAGAPALNAFVAIAADGATRLVIPASEMGQGVCTSLAQLLAEELDADWDRLEVITGEGVEFRRPLGPGYTMQVTGGSTSIPVWRQPLRKAGAVARDMLVRAAAARWGVAADVLTTEAGVVRHPDGRTATYGELAAEAALLRPSRTPRMKPPGSDRFVGVSMPRNDLHAKVTGQATFGVDIRIPGMLRACTVACPVIGGKVGSVDDAAARAITGVRDVLVFEDFVAVVADTWWPAKRGVAALKITWDEGANAGMDSASVSAALRGGLDAKRAFVARREGRGATGWPEGEVLSADYEVPYLDHVPMEPLNCTVHIQPERCDVWVGTQVQTMVLEATAKATGLRTDQVFVHTPFLGGGFGRRGNNDWVDQALAIAVRLDKPVQLLWTREEGIRHGFYRPGFAARLRAHVSEGKVDGFHVRLSGDNILHRYLPKLLQGLALAQELPLEGLLKTSPYAFRDVLMEGVLTDLPIPIGFWRSVSHSYTAFFVESFLDEVAARIGQDPVALRRSLIDEPHARFRAVLELAVEKGNWGSPATGCFQGVAIHESFGSICAQVAEVSMVNGLPRVHKVTAAVDCGPVVNPDLVRAQIMGGALFGLSEAMGARLDFKAGRVVQSNFHDYPLLRMKDAPPVEVHIVDNPTGSVGGIGEIGTPPIAPAVCNAIFAASGRRVRSLPILQALAGKEA